MNTKEPSDFEGQIKSQLMNKRIERHRKGQYQIKEPLKEQITLKEPCFDFSKRVKKDQEGNQNKNPLFEINRVFYSMILTVIH